MDFYHWTIKHLIPGVEFHQNRYARELETAHPRRWLDLGAGRRLHGGWLTGSQQELAARPQLLVGCDLEAASMAANVLVDAAVVADGRHLPFPSASFDLVTANMVLEHLEEPGAVFAEVARVLAGGGRFIFVTPNRRHPAVWLAALAVSRSRRKALAQQVEGRAEQTIFPTHYRANSVADIAELAGTAGLRVDALEVFSSYPLFRNPAPLTFVEALWIRLALSLRPLRPFGSNIMGCLEKPTTVEDALTRRPSAAALRARSGA